MKKYIATLMRIMALALVLGNGLSGIALADVPDIYGPNRRRPTILQKHDYHYQIYNEACNDSYAKDKIALEYKYYASKMSEIFFKAEDSEGEILAEGTQLCKNGYGTFVVVLPKPAKKQSYRVYIDTLCRLKYQQTSFGYKETDADLFRKKEKMAYDISCDDDDIISITSIGR